MQVYETLVRSADGTEHDVLFTKGLLRDARGVVEGCVGTMLNISERKRAEKALRESEERFRIMADGSPVIIWVSDTQGGNQFVNRRYREYFGVTFEEVQGGKWRPFLHPDDATKYLDEVLEAVRERKSFSTEARVRRKDGEWRLLASHGEPRYSTAGEFLGHIGISLDITDQRRLQDNFQQAQRLESVGRLAGGVAHDFNNLLTVILICAETLKRDLGTRRPADPELVQDIVAAGERARDVARQLLAFARRQVLNPVPLDLDSVVRGTEKLLRRVLGEDVEVTVTSQPGLWSVRCDPGHIEQVILNLAVNARDAMPGGGKLSVETSNVQIDENHIASHPFLRAGSFVRLAIRDSGHGMSPEVKAHAFEPFFTTKPKGEGTGLGLAMVYGIVKQSGGYVLLDSEIDRGTTFEIYFPRVPDAAVAVAAPSPVTATNGTETVLVVEDDPQVREVTVRSLRAGGYLVLAAGSARDALGMDPEELSRARLLITDVVMPGLTGPALADAICRRYPDLRVLYVSGYTQDAILNRGTLDSGIELLPKPFTASGLLDRVRAILDGPPKQGGPRDASAPPLRDCGRVLTRNRLSRANEGDFQPRKP
jgi:PAS domain S-box-containing protein